MGLLKSGILPWGNCRGCAGDTATQVKGEVIIAIYEKQGQWCLGWDSPALPADR
jgi:hypothetical protein